jgi:Low affinity iron permease
LSTGSERSWTHFTPSPVAVPERARDFIFGDPDTWQLVITTVTTIVTFLLVALRQNSQRRSATAVHEKLDAIADGLADLMEHQIDRDPEDFTADIDELKAAVGLQHKR